MALNYFITGGAGFIGSNYASRLISRGEKVIIFDNLSRKGADLNIKWLKEIYGEKSFLFVKGDIRDYDSLCKNIKASDVICHFAAQVAVTTSVRKPREDFEINALGTLNVLEAARNSGRDPVVLYSSTNKVYGSMENVKVIEGESRYDYEELPSGISEDQNLDFHSPYGCSKGAGDQYMLDYSRIYSLPTVVFRQSCIYGPRQFGIEDQGWVAWFLISTVTGNPITIYGNGKQIRDLLYIDDLLSVYDLAVENIKSTKGQVYNIGGGPANTISIWLEFSSILKDIINKDSQVLWGETRPGDQHVYVSDISKFSRETGWTPQIDVKKGIGLLYKWVSDNKKLFL